MNVLQSYKEVDKTKPKRETKRAIEGLETFKLQISFFMFFPKFIFICLDDSPSFSKAPRKTSDSDYFEDCFHIYILKHGIEVNTSNPKILIVIPMLIYLISI